MLQSAGRQHFARRVKCIAVLADEGMVHSTGRGWTTPRSGTDAAVCRGLIAAGYSVAILPFTRDVKLLTRRLRRIRPGCVFNLVECVDDRRELDCAVPCCT